MQESRSSSDSSCRVCMQRNEHLLGLTCGHHFCRDCWQTYFYMQIQAGLSTGNNRLARTRCYDSVVCREVVLEKMVQSVHGGRRLLRSSLGDIPDWIGWCPAAVSLLLTVKTSCSGTFLAAVDVPHSFLCTQTVLLTLPFQILESKAKTSY